MKPSTTSSRRSKKRRKRDSSSSSSSSSSDSSSSSSSSSPSPERRHHRRGRSSSSKKKSSSSRKTKSGEKKRKKEQRSTKVKSSSSSSATTTAGSVNNSVPNNNDASLLLAKLAARGETIEDREARRAARRAARITARFGYTPDDNPFHDPNLHEAFTWKKKEEKKKAVVVSTSMTLKKNGKRGNDDDDDDGDENNGNNIDEEKGEMIDNDNTNTRPKAAAPGKSSSRGGGNARESTFDEIDKVRRRRMAREEHMLEMDRLRAEESRMKELENYDEWSRKEEEFHLSQQRQRSAIRLVEGRERPVDVLAQNALLFGGGSSSNDGGVVGVKYREKYSAFNELSRLEANLDEPYTLLNQLTLKELEELLVDVNVYRSLERDAIIEKESNDGGGGGRNTIIRYWDALQIVTLDEIQYLKTGGHDDMSGGSHAILVKDIRDMFMGQSMAALVQMKSDIEQKLRVGGGGGAGGEIVDTQYWTLVLNQLLVHLAKLELSDIHSKMLVRQLEKLELRREELSRRQNDAEGGGGGKDKSDVDIQAEHQHHQQRDHAASSAMPLRPAGIEPDFGNLEEELGLDDEIDLSLGGMTSNTSYSYQDKYRPRKPRYFNRVKTGYDWNAYNKTHYDHDNPPPKTVQGYKFNVFYPDLLDKSRTPQYRLEKADTDEFCILRFSAGPPYEDVAFKIINRQWNKSRKSGFRCTFERGVLSLYFNFASHWYRR